MQDVSLGPVKVDKRQEEGSEAQQVLLKSPMAVVSAHRCPVGTEICSIESSSCQPWALKRVHFACVEYPMQPCTVRASELKDLCASGPLTWVGLSCTSLS